MPWHSRPKKNSTYCICAGHSKGFSFGSVHIFWRQAEVMLLYLVVIWARWNELNRPPDKYIAAVFLLQFACHEKMKMKVCGVPFR